MASQGIMANQRAAGGASGPDISGATATPEKVLIGETFFSGASEEMQTGTLTGAGMLKVVTGSIDKSTGGTYSLQITGIPFVPLAVEARAGGQTSAQHRLSFVNTTLTATTIYGTEVLDNTGYNSDATLTYSPSDGIISMALTAGLVYGQYDYTIIGI